MVLTFVSGQKADLLVDHQYRCQKGCGHDGGSHRGELARGNLPRGGQFRCPWTKGLLGCKAQRAFDCNEGSGPRALDSESCIKLLFPIHFNPLSAVVSPILCLCNREVACPQGTCQLAKLQRREICWCTLSLPSYIRDSLKSFAALWQVDGNCMKLFGK